MGLVCWMVCPVWFILFPYRAYLVRYSATPWSRKPNASNPAPTDNRWRSSHDLSGGVVPSEIRVGVIYLLVFNESYQMNSEPMKLKQRPDKLSQVSGFILLSLFFSNVTLQLPRFGEVSWKQFSSTRESHSSGSGTLG